MKDKFFTFLFFFLSMWLVLSFFTGSKNDDQKPVAVADIVIETRKDKMVIGQLISVTIQNNLAEEFVLGEDQYPPENLIFEKWFNGKWEQLHIQDPKTHYGKTVILPNGEQTLSFSEYNNELFGEVGQYRFLIKKGDQEFTSELAIESSGMLRSLWRSLFFKPIFNILIFFVKVFPWHSLALAILALTLLIKLILLAPSRKAMVQQQKMQKVQKEIDVLKKKYSGDQQKVAQETLAIWKKHKVNPFGTFLPMFIQFPIMIALYYVVREGLLPHNSIYLWPPLQGFSLDTVNQHLFFLDLGQTGVLWLAIFIGVLQFGSMKLALAKKKNATKKEDNKKNKKDNPEADVSQMQVMNNMMTYGLPFMIAFFTFSMPAAVGFYWGVSTAFSIVQQWFLNKEKDKENLKEKVKDKYKSLDSAKK